jgi:hypothetical protein
VPKPNFLFETIPPLLRQYMNGRMPSTDERVELETQITKARRLARGTDELTRQRLEALAAELEKKLRETAE